MTKQELLDAIKNNWFSSEEDLVDFIFEHLSELKADEPIMPEIEELKKVTDEFFRKVLNK